MAAAVALSLVLGATLYGIGSDDGDGASSSPQAAATAAARAAASAVPETPWDVGTVSGHAPAPDRTVEASGGFRLAAISRGTCTAEAPADWTIQASDRSDTVDLSSPDGTLYAGYGILAVNTALAEYAYLYDPPLNDPDLYSTDPATVAGAYGSVVLGYLDGSTDLVYTDELSEWVGDYRLRSVASSSHRGVIFFHASGFPGDGRDYSYALPMYYAFTRYESWAGQGLLVARVAASIRCTTQFQPSGDHPQVGDPSPGSSDAEDENGSDAGYDPQLGTEYVNDPSTRENYLVDPSQNWSENGPEGPGYYAAKGSGDYVKLEPGRVE